MSVTELPMCLKGIKSLVQDKVEEITSAFIYIYIYDQCILGSLNYQYIPRTHKCYM